MRESRGKSPNKQRVEPKARSEAERILLLKQALRSVAEIVDTALRDDHRSEYLGRQKIEPTQASPTPEQSRSEAGGQGAKVIVTPYVSSEMA